MSRATAVDIGQSDATAWLSRNGARYGLCQIYRNEPWHYELRPGATDRRLSAHVHRPDEGPTVAVVTGVAVHHSNRIRRMPSHGSCSATTGGREMAGRITAAVGSLAFLVLAPGVVAGIIPWLITHWGPLPPIDGVGALRWTGLILIAAGLVVVLDAFARFAREGLGTPAPVAPTRTLVVSGFYRYVRNPMYVAVAALIFGQAILFASWGVALYGVVIVAAFDTFVRLYEEPTLRRTYGERTPPIAPSLLAGSPGSGARPPAISEPRATPRRFVSCAQEAT